jgi:hypothetical protein
MVRTIVQLARQLRLGVLAEGVETEHQLELLRRLHCLHGQGYLFSQPIDAEAMTSFLAEWSGNGAPPSQGGSPTISCGATLRTSTVAAPSRGSEMSHALSVPHELDPPGRMGDRRVAMEPFRP